MTRPKSEPATGVRLIRFRDGTARCVDCKGFGLVRGIGPRAGCHYKTFSGACQAEDRGHAKPCPVCEGSGITGHLGIRGVMKTYGLDREAVNGEKMQLGVRSALMSDAGYEGSYLDRERTRGVSDQDSPVF